MSYKHTQHGYFHWLMYPMAAVVFIIAWQARADSVPAIVLACIGLLVVAIGFCFQSLTIADRGDRLQLTFGPLPLLRKSFRYSDIESVEQGKSHLIDGWGIHWVPGRGWTYNLWGYDCAVLRIHHRIVRIGTDEPQQLVSFLRERTGRP
ncbi:hypothetical protein [Aeoliella sp.]|uniref:hypothetical protein n=1 Tax=Aeoliella sp. TaxID=2795800 RepID=UPI003CCBE749